MSTRRSFLKSSAAAVGGSWAALATPAALSLMDLACRSRSEGRFAALSDEEATELDILTSLIVPSDETGPGAHEAGVIWYIDAVVAQDADDLQELRAGLADVAQRIAGSHSAQSLTQLGPDAQLALARAIEDTDFFRGLRDATLTGLLAHPKHGGNRNKLGWQLIGFDDRHAWQPPFGHYDAPFHE